MLSRTTITTTAIVALAVSLPASAGAQQDLRNADNRDARPAVAGQDLRNPDNRSSAPLPVSEQSPVVRELRSPDAVDASRRVGIYAIAPAGTTASAGDSGRGFQWDDAGVGAAAMLGLIGLAAGSLMIAVSVRRRRRFPVTSH
jgi:hypothetical protein